MHNNALEVQKNTHEKDAQETFIFDEKENNIRQKISDACPKLKKLFWIFGHPIPLNNGHTEEQLKQHWYEELHKGLQGVLRYNIYTHIVKHPKTDPEEAFYRDAIRDALLNNIFCYDAVRIFVENRFQKTIYESFSDTFFEENFTELLWPLLNVSKEEEDLLQKILNI